MPFQEGGRKVYLPLGCPGGVLWSQEKAKGLLSTASSLLVAVDALPYLANSLAHGFIHHPRQGSTMEPLNRRWVMWHKLRPGCNLRYLLTSDFEAKTWKVPSSIEHKGGPVAGGTTPPLHQDQTPFSCVFKTPKKGSLESHLPCPPLLGRQP